MRHLRLAISAALLAGSFFLHTHVAHAGTYNFTLSAIDSPALSGSGTFTTVADPTITGVQDIVSLTGTINNGMLTGDTSPASISLLATQPGQATAGYSDVDFNTGIDPTSGKDAIFHLTYDNDLTNGSALDEYGLGFTASDGTSYELAAFQGGYAYQAFNLSENFDQRTLFGPEVSLQITPAAASVTPEPASFALLSTGLFGMAGLVRRRFSR